MNWSQTVFNIKYGLLKKEVRDFKRNLIKNSNLSASELENYNWVQRKNVVTFAYKNIPFYKKFYDKNGFHPSDLKNQLDWHKVPILTKFLIKNNFNDLINPHISQSLMRLSTTGGSTGVPLKVYFDKRIPFEIVKWRVLNWWNVNPWENQAYVYRNTRKGFSKLLNNLYRWPTKQILLDCSSISNSDMHEFVKNFNTLKPSLLQGYVGGILELAQYINHKKINIHSPKAIWVTSAPLSEPTRDFIQNIFSAPVYDQYGCGEVFWLAAECKEQKGLHVLSDIRHIEFVNDQQEIVNKGEYGDIAITDFNNFAFPIIRYKNGDQGRIINSTCNCHLPFPLIDKIRGRVSDNIKTPSGILLNGSYLTTIFDRYPDLIEAFQIIQCEDYSIDINYVPYKIDQFSDNHFYKIKTELLNHTKNEVEIRLNCVSKLVQDQGKLKFIISKI